MKNKILIACASLVLVCIAVFAFVHKSKAPTLSETPSAVTYFCTEGVLSVVYGTSSVMLSLPSQQATVMQQATSGSGIRYELGSTTFVSEGEDAFLMNGDKTTYNNCVSGKVTYSGTTTNYADATGLFSFSFPSEFTFSGGDIGYTQDWRQGTGDLGFLQAVVTIPKTFMPKTNFGDAKFTVGVSADSHAVATCLVPDYGPMQNVSTTTINGVTYTKILWSDAGAGNLYETTSYRTIRDGICYAVEYTIHSSNIYNYSPDQGISVFDHDRVASILDGIARSFSFL